MRAWSVAVVALLSAVPTWVVAQPADEPPDVRARVLITDGRKALEAGRFDEALQDFEQAHALLESPFTAIWIARAKEGAGLLVEARAAALEVLRLPPEDDPRAREAYASLSEQAQDLVQQLDLRIPSAEVDVVGPPPGAVSLTVDGTPVTPTTTVRLNPGKHEARAEAPGFTPRATPFELREGETRGLRIVLDPTAHAEPKRPPPPPRPEKEPGARADALLGVGFAVAGAALLEGSITGVLSLDRASTLADLCGQAACPASLRGDWATANDLATASTVGFVVGAAGLVVGAIGIGFKIGDAKSGAEASGLEVGFGASGGSMRFRW